MEAFIPWLTPALIVALAAWLRSDLRDIRQEIRDLRRDFSNLAERVAGLAERVAHLSKAPCSDPHPATATEGRAPQPAVAPAICGGAPRVARNAYGTAMNRRSQRVRVKKLAAPEPRRRRVAPTPVSA